MSDVIPEGWSKLKLGDLSDLVTKGTTPKSYCSTGINFVKVESVSASSTLIPSKFAHIDLETHASLKRSQLKAGDILFSIAGSLGRLSLIQKKHLPANTNQALAIIRLSKDSINPLFCTQQLKGEVIQTELKKLQTVGAQPNLSLQQVSDILLVTPPLPEQQKIAAILSSVDEVIEKTQAQINKLKDLKTGMMQELLSPREGQAANITNPQGESKNSLHHTEFKDSPLGRIPVGWEVVRFNDVLEKIDSGWSPSCIETPPSSGEWGVLKVSAVTRGKFLEKQSKTLPENLEPRTNIRVRAGDILLTRANGVADLVGKCVMINQEPKSKLMMSDKILRLKPNNLIFDEFLLHTFNSQVTRRQIELSWGGSSGQKNIGQADIKNYRLALPSYEEQKVIARSISQVDNLLHEKSKKRDSLNHLKKALMQDLLTGKVRVTVDAT